MAGLLQESTATRSPASPALQPAVRTAIAVVMTYFPRIGETYILREINALEQNGQPVVIIPIVREYPSVVHDQAKPWLQRALFTPFLSKAVVASNVRALLESPGRYVRLLTTIVRSTIWRPSTLVRSLSIVPKAVHLARVLPDMGITHIHAHFATHSATFAWVISVMSGISFSFTVHGPDVFVHRLMLRDKIRRARFIRCISTFNKAFLSGLYPQLTEGKLKVVRTGVNPDVYEEASRTASKERARPRLLSVASLTPTSGFPFLIDACARLDKQGIEVDCMIVGDGPLRRTTEEWIAEHGLTDRVRILGNLPQHEVARLMGEADIFVMPSVIAPSGQMEGIPVSLMEAMAAGKPVVSASISGIPELVRNEVNGLLVDAAHPQRIAAAVRRLIEDPALAARLGAEGRETVRRRFDVRSSARQLIELLDAHVDEPETHSLTDRIRHLQWNRINAVTVGVRRVRERGTSSLAEVTIHDGVTTQEVVVRQHCGSREEALASARTEFEILTTLAQSMPNSVREEGTATSTLYSVPKLLMFDEENAAIVTRRAEGNALAGILRHARERNTGRVGPALRKTGTWLRVFQHHTTTDDEGRHLLTGIVLLAIEDLDLVCAADPAVAGMREALRTRLETLEAQVSEQPLPVVGCHGRFRPDNIFVGGRSVETGDFSAYREGLALEDVAELLLHLDLYSSRRWYASRLPALRAAFLDGYAGRDAAPDERAMQLFTLTRALRLLAHEGVSDAERAAIRNILQRCLS